MPTWLRDLPSGVAVEVLVQPRASRTKIVGEHDGRLKVQLAAPPVDGEANAALVAFFADLLGLPKRAVEVASGATGRRKTLRIEGVDAATAEGRLASKNG